MTAAASGRIRQVETALCCACGTVRTIGIHYRHRDDRALYDTWNELTPPHRRQGLGLKYARCATCRAATPHACINDGPDEWAGRDWREEQNRRDDVARRRVRRRIRMLEESGVDVRYYYPEDAGPGDGRGEVHQWREDGGEISFLVMLDETLEPEETVKQLERVEDYIDDPDRLGDWAPDPDGSSWRGVALPNRSVRP